MVFTRFTIIWPRGQHGPHKFYILFFKAAVISVNINNGFLTLKGVTVTESKDFYQLHILSALQHLLVANTVFRHVLFPFPFMDNYLTQWRIHGSYTCTHVHTHCARSLYLAKLSLARELRPFIATFCSSFTLTSHLLSASHYAVTRHMWLGLWCPIRNSYSLWLTSTVSEGHGRSCATARPWRSWSLRPSLRLP